MPLTYKEIAEIIKMIDASSCDEFVVEVGDLKIAVRRRSTGTQTSAPSPAPSAGPPASRPSASSPQPKGRAAQATVPERAATPTARTDTLIEVRSPMTGMFYSRPSPDAEPFVSVGKQVNKGDPLCLVEVMKLFTTIYTELNGRIASIAATDGQLVEHDQVLFLIEPV